MTVMQLSASHKFQFHAEVAPLCCPNEPARDTQMSLEGGEADTKMQRTKPAPTNWPHTIEESAES